MLSEFEGHRIKGLGDMIFQNCHENAKEAGIRQQAATQLRRAATQLRRAATQLRHPAGNGHAAASAATQPAWARQAGRDRPRSCVGPAPALRQPCCQEKKKKKVLHEPAYMKHI